MHFWAFFSIFKSRMKKKTLGQEENAFTERLQRLQVRYEILYYINYFKSKVSKYDIIIMPEITKSYLIQMFKY